MENNKKKKTFWFSECLSLFNFSFQRDIVFDSDIFVVIQHAVPVIQS